MPETAEFYKRARERWATRERLGYVSWRNPRPLFRPGAPCIRPPEMNMQEPSGEYLRRAPIRVRRVSKDEADQNWRAALPLCPLSRSCTSSMRVGDRSLLASNEVFNAES